MIEKIHIYHTNDLHSHFENWPRISRFLSERKRQHEVAGEEVIFLDLGDFVDKWHPLTEGSKGKASVPLLNEVGYDAVTIGNNEGITFSHEELDTMYKEAQFDVVVANLYTKKGQRPKWVKPYIKKKLKSGFTFAIIGITAYYEHFYQLLGWKMTPPLDELKKVLDDITDVDGIILMSHLGIRDDEWIATEHEVIDVLLGGHTHHLLPNGKVIHQSLLGAAGKYGYYIGHVQLSIDTSTNTIVNKTATVYKTEDLEEKKQDQKLINDWMEQGKSLLNKEVVKLKNGLKGDWFNPSPLTQLLCDAIHHWTKADCTFINSGLVLGDLPQGSITQYHIHSLLPHPINPCAVTLTGAELKEVIKQSLNPELPQLQLKGLGFRGQVMGNIVYKGITIGESINDLSINGEKIELHREYRLGTTDMFTFGHFFPELKRAKKTYYMPEFIRDVFSWELKKHHS
ncbi:bifunctional UDP-sugar hydrolase/5'-nucleotidase [Bacillus spongiae]|uniref:Bifunctional UDP-sugar hydrolase/5'-nucleotidase n=1 Tax=Bacillus spongiae TaxID=2683610 RepID=A0ABU8HER7_9BACI